MDFRIIISSIRNFWDNLSSIEKITLLVLFVLRFVLCFLPPFTSTDFHRNLFYGRAFWEHGFTVYDLTPLDIDPNYSIVDPSTGKLAYEKTTYDYLTLQLLFWATMVLLPFPEVTAKIIISFADLGVFLLLKTVLTKKSDSFHVEKDGLFAKIFSTESKWLPFTYYLFSIPLSCIEGQSTGILVLFFMSAVYFTEDNPFWAIFIVGLGFQWKYVTILLIPYILIVIWERSEESRDKIIQVLISLGVFLIPVVLLSFPILFSGFVLRYVLFFGDLPYDLKDSNPLVIFYFSPSSILMTIIVMVVVYVIIFPVSSFIEEISSRISLIPFLGLSLFLKYYRNAFPWYWLWFYPLIAIIEKPRQRVQITLLLFVTLGIGLIDFVWMTVGFDYLLHDLLNF